MQCVVPDGIVDAGDGVVYETHVIRRRVAGVHRYVYGVVARAHAVVPYHGVDYETVTVEVESARLRGVRVGQVGGRYAAVVDDGVLQEHASAVAVYRSVARRRVVRHHAG